MSAWTNVLGLWILAACVMLLGWLWQRRYRNTGIVDVLWSAGLGAAAIGLAAWGSGAFAPRAALAVCGGIWGLRLAHHLWKRVRREPEDGRYRQLRQHWQGSQIKQAAFFQFQGVLIVLFALPFFAVASNTAAAYGWLSFGIVVWMVSVLGESIADSQLARFRQDPLNRGKTCQDGLWRVSRHPNYFFEWLHWFTYVCFAMGSPLAWLAWMGPVVMYLFLRFVSGIPWTEAQALRTRGDDYRAYQHRTSMLIPWFPKRPRNVRG